MLPESNDGDPDVEWIILRRREIRREVEDASDDGTYDALVDAYDQEYTSLYDQAVALGVDDEVLDRI